MSFRVLPDGSIETTDASEAIALSLLLQAAKAAPSPATPQAESQPRHPTPTPTPAQSAPSAAPPPVTIEETFAELIERMRGRGEMVAALRMIKARGTISINELRNALNLKSNFAVSGIMAGLTKNAGKLGIASTDVVMADRDNNGVMTYRSGKLLRNAPDEWLVS